MAGSRPAKRGLIQNKEDVQKRRRSFRQISDAKACMIYGNDRALVTSARQAAEALFALKPPLDKSPVSEPGQPAEAMPPRPLARSPPTRRKNEPPITVIIGGRALLMLIAARFSGPGSSSPRSRQGAGVRVYPHPSLRKEVSTLSVGSGWISAVPDRCGFHAHSAHTSPPSTRARAHVRAQLGEQVDRHARAAKRRIPAHDLAYQPILGRRSGRAD